MCDVANEAEKNKRNKLDFFEMSHCVHSSLCGAASKNYKGVFYNLLGNNQQVLFIKRVAFVVCPFLITQMGSQKIYPLQGKEVFAD